MEQETTFFSGGLEIEARLERGTETYGAVITHPHPLLGGNMHNPVVETIRDAYHEMGYTTLRFNFRGTGKSRGSYDDGRGEQEDVKSAVSYLAGLGISTIDLAGYSFGAWVNLTVSARTDRIRDLVLVSPPVDFMDFSNIRNTPSLKLVVSGNRDEYASSTRLRELLPGWNPKATWVEIAGCDHFYSGFLNELHQSLLQNLRDSAITNPTRPESISRSQTFQ